MKNVGNVFLDYLPNIDLHGLDQMSARVVTNDFIRENIKLGNKKIVIIHGIGEGILKEMVHLELKKNKMVDSYYLDGFNIGCTVVNLKEGNGYEK